MISKTNRKTLRLNGYDYSDSYRREETASALLDEAASAKDRVKAYWKRMRRYYDGVHDINSSTSSFYAENNIPWRAAQSTDGYIHVETQIEPDIPDFEFSPRCSDDAEKAKQREKIVRYVLDNNDMEYKNSRNERTLGICGSAVWKVCWDSAKRDGFNGDVCIESPMPDQIYPDPTAADVDSCEYIGYVYKMHSERAKRVFADDFRMYGTDISECMRAYTDCAVMSGYSEAFDGDGNGTVTVTEWWFRQPTDGKLTKKVISDGAEKSISYSWKSGDIALCVFINGREVRYVPKYWTGTSFNCYPFVIYNRIPGDRSIWGKSELEQIIPLIDAKDRELAYAQLNLAYNANDIILAEENAFSDGELPDNTPGAVWKLRPGMMGKVQRLGNTAAYANSLYNGCSYWKSLIEDTTGNFEISQGKEPSSVTTATGIALLNERSQTRKSLKSIDRSAGFKRLFALIDATALEYYSDGRVISLSDDKDGIVFRYSEFTSRKPDSPNAYIPSVDVIIHTGNAAASSRALTVYALNTLMGMKITKDNYILAKAYVNAINIPERAQICEFLDARFENDAEFLTEEDI